MQINKHIDYEQKLQAVTEYLQGQTSEAKIAAKYGVKLTSFQTWLNTTQRELMGERNQINISNIMLNLNMLP